MRQTARACAAQPGLRRVLTLPGLVLFGLVYLVPLTVFTTYGLVSLETGGRLPTAYLLTLCAMLFTAQSYAVMGRAFPVAGSAFTFARLTFGASAGFLAGWALLLDYLFLPMINYLVIGIYLGTEFPGVAPWVFVLACIVLVTVLNHVGIASIARVNVVLIAAQAVFIVVFAALALHHLDGIAGPIDLLAPLRGSAAYAARGVDPSVGWGPLFSGAAMLCLSFLGFDAVSTMAEESAHPTRDIPRAVLLVTLGGGLLFIALAYLSHLVLPEPTCLPALDPKCAFGDNGSLDVMNRAGGRLLSVFFVAAYVAGAFGSALTAQASVCRILYCMGRDGLLPGPLAALSARYRTPTAAIGVVSLLSLLAIWIDLGTLTSMISFGALAAFSVVNLAVIKLHVVDRRERRVRDLLRYGLAPLVGCALTAWLWTSLQAQSLVVGLCWLAAGAAYLLVLTRGLRRMPPAIGVEDSVEV
jgi:amino acid transporter